MRLINVRTMQLEEFSSGQIPKYAILSHRWGAEEVSLQDMDTPKFLDGKAGFSKINSALWLARNKGYSYLWVDTCCIDKNSSSELTEAINSMYRWYQEAEVCFAYLSDIELHQHELSTSVWFTRGWTLQELIAPKHVSFYDRNWVSLGTKEKLAPYLSAATGIDLEVLLGRSSPSSCSVAQRMSWAAKRETTRLEDSAYSLLGIFDVSMPMVYGEGEKAFRRLQEEILKVSDDHTIFAWDTLPKGGPGGHSGLLATSPSQFERCQNVVRSSTKIVSTGGFSLSNVGLSIQLLTIPWYMETYLAVLNCGMKKSPRMRLGIFLERLLSSHDQQQFARVQYAGVTVYPVSLDTIAEDSHCRPRLLHVRPTIIDPPLGRWHGFRLHDLKLPGYKPKEYLRAEFCFRDSWPHRTRYHPSEMESARRCLPNGLLDLPARPVFFGMPKGRGTAGIVYVPPSRNDPDGDLISWMKFGFDEEYAPMCIFGRRRSLWGGGSAYLAVDHDSFDDAEHIAGEHALLFRNEWIIKEKGCRDMKSLAAIWQTRNFCMLRGDRERGLDVKIPFLRIHITIQLENVYEGYAPYGRPNDLMTGMNIWTISVTSWEDHRQRGGRIPDLGSSALIWKSLDDLFI
ncbi:heterokaryon incompatibility protein-domain-containing protein [Exophiala viscosa]|uniref:Heterokaryon incompatibility protein-domain-containing protein n=1 Tax=Exophiala viscosa TaxID=2486360 RepID=A0AAN6IKJ8_9EURO|nr:heterokaryon incompatibility protein-domain-containing protein [Exophiala viscosa]KAI1627741.1 heterokaryon incompatibility protein-domain-containing protein [Exophiala viscosa]